MNTAVINKRFTFDAAHQLPSHDGKCARLHGHTYAVEVTLSGPVRSPDGYPDESMVVDFYQVSKVFKDTIEALCDHRFMIPLRHPRVRVEHQGELLAVLLNTSRYVLEPQNFALLPIDNTTAECLSAWMLDTMRQQLPQTVAVRVYETPTSYAEAVYVGDLG